MYRCGDIDVGQDKTDNKTQIYVRFRLPIEQVHVVPTTHLLMLIQEQIPFQ